MSMLTAAPGTCLSSGETLRNTLDWSFGLLFPPIEKALFARLGVFAGTFGLPAAEAVCGGNQQVRPDTPWTR